MQHKTLRPRQALPKAYLRLKTAPYELERFKAALFALLDSINPQATAEQARNYLQDFLFASFYSGYGVSIKGPANLAIHTSLTTKSSTGVLLEVKQPGNWADMPNSQYQCGEAVHELLHLYLQEREQHKNNDLRHLILTDVYKWFIFDALEFDRAFYRNNRLRQDFTNWSVEHKSCGGNEFFYRELAAPAIGSLTEGIACTYFDLRDYGRTLRSGGQKAEVELAHLYKLLSPQHLLKGDIGKDAQPENNSPVCYAQAKNLREGF